MAMPAAAGGLLPSQLSVHGPHGMPHRLRQVRRGDMEGAGAGGNVDLSDVQTMADSWLRLLEVAHTTQHRLLYLACSSCRLSPQSLLLFAEFLLWQVASCRMAAAPYSLLSLPVVGLLLALVQPCRHL